jgi:alkylation response protein AidB-like acyl-CoA dehydrogenase
MSEADLMGFTLPRKYGGLNCPNLIYTMATEIVSRADASFMNMFGLQGIAETVHAFASDEIKDDVLPRFASGEVTGAMVLTEPDAGSDLQAVRLRADQDESGNWVLNGVKRFITNGCGDILLVLARTEPEISDGRGLSLLITERSKKVRVRHLEDKLGIHGSPTCELVFNNAPARLIGERQRGLITYVLALMNGARVSVAAQSLGIAEAAYRLARTYAHTRQQFGGPIERLPGVAELVTDMQVTIEAARALAYETSRTCDRENNNLRILEWKEGLEKDERKRRKQFARSIKRLNGMLTPMTKYYCSEMCCWVADRAIQVLGGSGYMRDYSAERHLRDARITTIYEGTSQLQLVAAVRGVSSGTFESYVGELEKTDYQELFGPQMKKLDEVIAQVTEAISTLTGPAKRARAAAREAVAQVSAIQEELVYGKARVGEAIRPLLETKELKITELIGAMQELESKLLQAKAQFELFAELKEKLVQARQRLLEAISFVKGRSSSFLDLSGRRLVDAAITVICGHLLLNQATRDERKLRVARRFIETGMPVLRMNCEQVLSGDTAPLEEYDLLAGPVPVGD